MLAAEQNGGVAGEASEDDVGSVDQGVSSTLEIDERATVLRGTAVGQLVIESPEGRSVVLVEAADTISVDGVGMAAEACPEGKLW